MLKISVTKPIEDISEGFESDTMISRNLLCRVKGD